MEKPGILFLDAAPELLTALRRCLRKEPYRCFFSEGPDQALEVLREKELGPIVVSQVMPSMDGVSFLRMRKSTHSHVARVILTGNADLKIAIQAINEGEVLRFLTKPWNDVELKMTLRQLFDFIRLRCENQGLMKTVRKQQAFIDRLSSEHPDIFEVERDDSGAILIDMDPDGG